MTLLEQQDWTWTLNGPALNCDQDPTFVPTLEIPNATASPQGTEFNQALVQYFFDNLCGIHTVLDDTAERFKALVNRYLGSSPLLHKSVVCMAAAHCFQDDESMLPMCLECHTAAVRSLSEAVFQIETVLEQPTGSPRNSALAGSHMLRRLEETLLASIILGFCAVSILSNTPHQHSLLTSSSLGPIPETWVFLISVEPENCVNTSSITQLWTVLRRKRLWQILTTIS